MLGRAGFLKERLAKWLEILSDTAFRWFLTAVPWRHPSFPSSNVQELASTATLARFAELLRARNDMGSVWFDRGIAEPTIGRDLLTVKVSGEHPLFSGPGEHLRRIVGTPSHVDSKHVPELWVADGIAYLLHKKLNQGTWRSAYDDVWAILQDKIWLSPEGLMTGWGYVVRPPDDKIEAEIINLVKM